MKGKIRWMSYLMVMLLVWIGTPAMRAGAESITSVSKKVIKINEKVKIQKNVRNAKYTFKSSNSKVASVSGSGQIKGISAGTAKITVTVKWSKGGKTYTRKKIFTVHVKGITISKTKLKLYIGQKSRLRIGNLYKGTTVKWKTSQKSVAEVSGGLVTAKKAGQAVISVTFRGKTVSCRVTVLEKPYFNKSTVYLYQQETTKLWLRNAISSSRVYYSSDPTVAVVDESGTVTCVGSGKAVITCEQEGTSRKVKCTVYGYSNSAETETISLMVNKSGINNSVNLLEKIDLRPGVTASKVSYSYSNPSLGTVSAGVYTAKDHGTNTVTVTVGTYQKIFKITSYKWIAHRGDMGVYPENSLDSFEEAAKGGAYAIETDLHMTSDGTLVCIHDAKVDCTTNGTGLVDDLTTDEISALQIDVGNGISSCTRKKIPTLREYLNICKQYNCVAVIEIKRMYHKTDEQKLQMMNMLWNEIRAAGMKGQCVISSYYVEYLELFRQVDPSVTPVAYLYSSGNSNSTAEGVSRVNALANSGVTLSNAFGSRVTKDYNPITQVTGLAWKTFHTCTAAG